MKPELRYEDGLWLPPGHESLVRGMPRAEPGAVHALSVGGGYSLRAGAGRTVYFGRNSPEVHVCVGENDRQVSRVHGELAHQQGGWWLRNVGRQPIRLPRSRWLFPNEPAIALTDGYTPLYVPGSREREHLVEVYVTALDEPCHEDETILPDPYPLTPEERLILVVLGQRYLAYDTSPQPLTWVETARQVAELQPDEGWTAKKVEHRVALVRERLSRSGVPDLTREEIGEPVGNTLNHNLVNELIRSMTLTPEDLVLVTSGA